MKRFSILLLSLLVLVSCGPRYSGLNGVKTQKDAEAEFTASLTDKAKSDVEELADRCMELLKDGSVDEAVDMIYVLYNDVVYKKSDSYTLQLQRRFRTFPVLSYERLYTSFSTEGNNDISYQYVFKEASEGSPASTMKLMFNPVYVDGEWYLTFKEMGQSSKDLPVDKQINDQAPAPNTPRLNKRPKVETEPEVEAGESEQESE